MNILDNITSFVMVFGFFFVLFIIFKGKIDLPLEDWRKAIVHIS